MTKTTIRLAAAAPLLLALAACGSATDASEDALADNVELPADQAMEGTPEPVADPDALAEEAVPAEGDEGVEGAAAEAEALTEADAPAADDQPEAGTQAE